MEKQFGKLAIIGGRAVEKDGRLYTHASFGRIIEEFSRRYHHIYLSAPMKPTYSSEDDYLLPSNITLFPQPNWHSTADSLKNLTAIKNSYRAAITAADHVFVRGNPVAATSALYRFCAHFNKPVCHWLVGNPMALLRSHNRDGVLKDTIGKLFIWQWEKTLLRGRSRANGALICNGKEIAERYETNRTFITVSTSLKSADFYERTDTCQGTKINILCLCYFRPEKGIEYLIDAFSMLETSRPKQLLLVGSRDNYPSYQKKLDRKVDQHNLKQNVSWLGHIKYQDIPKQMREADIFVLPTLSEGTPRVLVEARANCLPIVATRVGGIPTSVKHGFDGLLVAAKDATSLSNSIEKVIKDTELRRMLIKNGFSRVRELTVDSFADQVINTYTDESDNDRRL